MRWYGRPYGTVRCRTFFAWLPVACYEGGEEVRWMETVHVTERWNSYRWIIIHFHASHPKYPWTIQEDSL